ncbi:hypothetical protein WN943_011844 [Citrus x changshan-huyou]
MHTMRAARAAGTKRECNSSEEDQQELRRGPWTLEEDTLLTHYIHQHGEGRWNMVAKCAGLKRTGKSCRLRWLNYLKPDIKRGNLTPQEQFLILELHSKWGNRLLQKMEQNSASPNTLLTNSSAQSSNFSIIPSVSSSTLSPLPSTILYNSNQTINENSSSETSPNFFPGDFSKISQLQQPGITQQPTSPHAYGNNVCSNQIVPNDSYYVDCCGFDMEGYSLTDPIAEMSSYDISSSECQMAEADWMSNDMSDALWNMDDIWQLRE